MHGTGHHVNNYLMEDNHDCYQYYSGLHAPDDVYTILNGIPEDNGVYARETGELCPPRNLHDVPDCNAGQMTMDMELSTP